MLAEPLAPPPIPGLGELFRRFDVWNERIPLEVLSSHLARLDLTRDDLSAFSVFDAECYCRNRLHRGPAYEALLLCWKPGQKSPIHDHARSSCAFRVLQGECTETVYEPADRFAARERATRVVAAGSTTQTEGFVCASQDSDIHEVANLGSGNLQTLHVYSPPLLEMETYEAS